MADAIPDPPGKQSVPQSTIVTEKELTIWEALKQAGWWMTFDWIMVILVALVWLVGANWKIFGNPTATQMITMLLLALNVKFVWLISLAFRCSYFVLKLNADVATLPQASARIAVAYLSGQK